MVYDGLAFDSRESCLRRGFQEDRYGAHILLRYVLCGRLHGRTARPIVRTLKDDKLCQDVIRVLTSKTRKQSHSRTAVTMT